MIPGPLPIDIGGLHITDNRAGDPQAHTFAALTFIPANGYARFIADGTTSQGPSHLSFSLDRNGDAVYLHNGATLVDSIAFGNQIPEFTIGRIGTAGTWTLCTNNGTPGTVGTFGAANVTRQLGDPNVARISEWFTSGDVLYDAD